MCITRDTNPAKTETCHVGSNMRKLKQSFPLRRPDSSAPWSTRDRRPVRVLALTKTNDLRSDADNHWFFSPFFSSEHKICFISLILLFAVSFCMEEHFRNIFFIIRNLCLRFGTIYHLIMSFSAVHLGQNKMKSSGNGCCRDVCFLVMNKHCTSLFSYWEQSITHHVTCL